MYVILKIIKSTKLFLCNVLWLKRKSKSVKNTSAALRSLRKKWILFTENNLCALWFIQMSSLRMLLNAFFPPCHSGGWIFHTFSQLVPEYRMNKLHCFIIDWEKRCRCDNSWQNGPAANWKHSWRGSRCSCPFFFFSCPTSWSNPYYGYFFRLFLQNQVFDLIKLWFTRLSVSFVSPRPCTPYAIFEEDGNFTAYFINMSFIIIIDVSDVNDDSL